MVLISRKERDLLEAQGFVFGRDLFKTVGSSKKKTYYATETSKVINALNKIRE